MPNSDFSTSELAWLIRKDSLEMTHVSHASHIGSDLSCADILAVIYNDLMHIDPNNPELDDRDYFLMGKGHASAALYSCLANVGFFPRERLTTFYQDGSALSGHVTKHRNPGIELSTGSLGHALAVGVGLAYAFKKDKRPNKVYCLMGDGECQEGSVYEAISEASRDQLDNLVVFIDHNRQQGLGNSQDLVPDDFIEKQFLAMGWEVRKVNGHGLDEIRSQSIPSKGKPLCVLCETIKGHPISFMKNQMLWHYRFPHDGEEYDNGRRELLKVKPNGLKNPYEEEDSLL